MTTDGGGWTLVLQQSKNGTSGLIQNNESRIDPCLLNTEEDCSQARFHNKHTIMGTSYMRKIADSKFLIVKFGDIRTCGGMNTSELPDYTYYADDPLKNFKGYSNDWGAHLVVMIALLMDMAVLHIQMVMHVAKERLVR